MVANISQNLATAKDNFVNVGRLLAMLILLVTFASVLIGHRLCKVL